MKIERIKTTLVKPYWRNPRINEDIVEYLMKVIIEYGFNNPIVLDKEDTIIAGHTRYKACIKLEGTLTERVKELRDAGMEDTAQSLQDINDGYIYAIRRRDLPPDRVKAWRIEDNQISTMARFDPEKLKFELQELDKKLITFTINYYNKILKDMSKFDKVTDELIKKYSDEIDKRYFGDHNPDDLVELICPHCRDTFSMRVKEIMERDKYKVKTEKDVSDIST